MQFVYKFFKKCEYNHFISGGVGGATSMLITYPLETIRSRIMLQTNHSHYKGLFNALKQLSIREYYLGLNCSLIGYSLYSSLFKFNFVFNSKLIFLIKSFLLKFSRESLILTLILASSLSTDI